MRTLQYILPFYFLFILFCSSIIYGQNTYEFEKLTGENGVSQSITYAVQQDSIGNIWMATEEGLIKYNASQSVVYSKYNGLPKEVGNRISAVFVDSKNRVWIGTEVGICLYNPELDSFKYINPDSDIKPTLIKNITEDNKGNILIASFNGCWIYNKTHQNNNGFKRFANKLHIQDILFYKNEILLGTTTGLYVFDAKPKFPIRKSGYLKDDNIISLCAYNDAFLIGTMNSGLLKSDLKFSDFENIKLNGQHENFAIRDITLGKNNTLYIGADGAGIFYLDRDFKLINHFFHNEDNYNSLSSNGVYDILIDKEDIIWVATYGGGINYLDENKLVFQKIKHAPNDKNSIINNFTRAIEKDKNNNIWFGTKRGVSIWNRDQNTWKHSSENDEIILALESDGDYMWVGTYNNGAYKVNINDFSITRYATDTPKKIGLNKVYAIFKDSKNNIWLGGTDGELSEIRPNGTIQTYPIKEIKSITESVSGAILLGGRNGVSRINLSDRKLEVLGERSFSRNNINYFTINTVIEKPDKSLILATNGSGIVFYNAQKDTVKLLSVASGLPSDIVQGVIAHNDELWASTTKGLVHIKMNAKDTIISIFDKSDGLASTEYNYGSYAKLNDSLFIFGGTDGLSLFNPYEVKDKNRIPKVIFEDFSLFNKKLEPGEAPLSEHINTIDKLNLKYGENSLALSFAGVLQSSPSKIRYIYKLEGFDESWSQPTKKNDVNYTNLAPGDYIFKVKAANRNGDWSKERQLAIHVMSPWWRTNLAYFGYVVLGILAILFIVLLTRVIVNKRNAEEQINLFNNLTHEIRTPLSILLSSLDNISKSDDNENVASKQAKKTIKRLNTLFDQMLNFHKATSNNNLFETITKLDMETYITEAVNNFKPLLTEKKLEITVDNQWHKEVFYFDKEALSKILYNLITNAIKYTPECGKIAIHLLETSKGELQIKIIDNGIGIPKDQQKFILKRFYRARNVINSQQPGTGLGLIMVKKLIEKYDGTIQFESKENAGTTFTVVLKNQEKFYKKSAVLNSKEQSNLTIHEQTNIEEFSDAKILVVEDNDELRTLLVNSLSTYFQVFDAANGKEGLKKAAEFFPDLILTDLIMPEMDGMAMSRILNDDINLNHIPIFMLSVLNNYDQKLESIESGVTEYIEKPVDINLLLAKIANTLNWQYKLREKYVNESDKDAAVKYRNIKDQEFITKLETFLLEKISNTDFSVHDLCDFIGMSRTSLYMKLKNLIDLSPQDFIIHTRLKYSKELLIKGNANIKEVAYHAGFSNPKYFSTSFKKFYGTTPSSFLESLQ
ncbi:ATP-binding protein [Aureibaculum sp. 2210JD6-5]|uniref:ATP-binding protein n=1 Tax=Aureibaculum sp. 2210JD6-5 TaxID=3103957 RepID=UPI002AAC9450|nr:ATP-binding protein [Aureibaculum sp. 2210JD6-5]MDY7396807.1 ATP-binding protein [Aureibaculum sp. 2210JD6-5]